MTVDLREIALPRQVDLRVDPIAPAATRIGELLGTPLPVVPNTGSEAVLWLGPDEWLVFGASEDQLRTALGDTPGSVVDVSANRVVYELSGPDARDVLEQGCAIDLHPRAFGPGRCAQTMLARANVILHQVDAAPTYRLLVRPSFAGYLTSWLRDAMSAAG
ncbi:sarcosine oxidase subunit gamma [Kutzneria buriramensis]|uniref:Sarcosine oxidase subunit gamma n=1 Tax=Kutzneria buriramensis TaxID=1045776 RepID=A0A3E0H2C2_9PSEU|nr:sarcosine oxidase subunit gamma family protein [Kutzneria buriramensis]REH37252.1 sarcosine oxidase subunit gamma [Kutzneria buriramensis]